MLNESMTIPSVSVQWSLAAEAPDGWSHHGLAVLPDGTVVGYHPRGRELLFFDATGAIVRRAACDAMEAHDIELDGDTLWLADCGHRLELSTRSRTVYVSPPVAEAVGHVWHVDLEGRTLEVIDGPDERQFLPTGVALDERGLWVADGYGSHRVFLYDRDRRVLLTLEGFDTPHGIEIDRRRDEPEVVIAERGAHRLSVHALDGTFLRHEGVGDLVSPCATTVVGAELHVADLSGRVSVLDIDGALVEHLGPLGEQRKGWPNALDADGKPVPPDFAPDRFNSPHGITTVGGDVVVTEWVLGGRWIRYSPSTSKAR
jgi:hypothetical protein